MFHRSLNFPDFDTCDRGKLRAVAPYLLGKSPALA